jgi:hypothetical protein
MLRRLSRRGISRLGPFRPGLVVLAGSDDLRDVVGGRDPKRIGDRAVIKRRSGAEALGEIAGHPHGEIGLCVHGRET